MLTTTLHRKYLQKIEEFIRTLSFHNININKLQKDNINMPSIESMKGYLEAYVSHSCNGDVFEVTTDETRGFALFGQGRVKSQHTLISRVANVEGKKKTTPIARVYRNCDYSNKLALGTVERVEVIDTGYHPDVFSSRALTSVAEGRWKPAPRGVGEGQAGTD